MSKPQSIEELWQWYVAMKLPPMEETRFFIGINTDEPKAFGIYKDEPSGKIFVYKNKTDGSRAIRYEGTDEAAAVAILHDKLKEEILNRKEAIVEKKASVPEATSKVRFTPSYTPKKKPWTVKRVFLLALQIFLGCLAALILYSLIYRGIQDYHTLKNGYYVLDDQPLYYLDDVWYYYDDDLGDWYYYDDYIDYDDFSEGYYNDFYEYWDVDDYYYGEDYDSSISSFEDTQYYDDWSSYHSIYDYTTDDDDYQYSWAQSDDDDSWWSWDTDDDDDDWSWDTDDDWYDDTDWSWDSDYTDWDSDW